MSHFTAADCRHSPLPWSEDDGEILDADGNSVTDVGSSASGRCEADADLIIDAVNDYEANEALIKELVEALKPFAEAAATYDPAEDDDAFEAWRETFSIGALRTARDAVAKAEAR